MKEMIKKLIFLDEIHMTCVYNQTDGEE